MVSLGVLNWSKWSPGIGLGLLLAAMLWPAVPWAKAITQEARLTHYPTIEMAEDFRSFDVVAAQDGLHAVLVVKGSQPGSTSIFYTFSKDGGNTWNKSVHIDRKDDAPVLSKRGNDIKLAVQGQRRVVVWQVSGQLPGMGPMVIAYSDDGGQHWQRGNVPAREDSLNNQSYMEVAADSHGHFHLIWLDDREENGNTQGLRYASSQDGGHDWQNEVTLDPQVCTCCWNRLLVLPGDRVSLLYRDDDPHDMRMRLRLPDADWQDLGPVGAFNWRFQGCPHCGGGIAAVKRGEQAMLHAVVWTGKENEAGLYYLSSGDFGRSWRAPLHMGGGQSREGDIAARSVADLALVYNESDAQGTTIRYRQSKDGGKGWSVPRDLSAKGKQPDHPRILAFQQGFKVFWTEKLSQGRKSLAMQSLQ